MPPGIRRQRTRYRGRDALVVVGDADVQESPSASTTATPVWFFSPTQDPIQRSAWSYCAYPASRRCRKGALFSAEIASVGTGNSPSRRLLDRFRGRSKQTFGRRGRCSRALKATEGGSLTVLTCSRRTLRFPFRFRTEMGLNRARAHINAVAANSASVSSFPCSVPPTKDRQRSPGSALFSQLLQPGLQLDDPVRCRSTPRSVRQPASNASSRRRTAPAG